MPLANNFPCDLAKDGVADRRFIIRTYCPGFLAARLPSIVADRHHLCSVVTDSNLANAPQDAHVTDPSELKRRADHSTPHTSLGYVCLSGHAVPTHREDVLLHPTLVNTNEDGLVDLFAVFVLIILDP
jgi:hypothetical protein